MKACRHCGKERAYSGDDDKCIKCGTAAAFRPEFAWTFDVNRRVYAPGSMGPPIWREHWHKQKVVGENRASYLLEHGGKVPKKPCDQTHVFDEAYLNELVWAHAQRPYIVEQIRRERETGPAKLREIAALIGYTDV